jgi:hypothetical protein
MHIKQINIHSVCKVLKFYDMTNNDTNMENTLLQI